LHRERHGAWPTEDSGAVEVAPGENWCNIAVALRDGNRGLPGGDTLPQLLGRRCGARTWSTMLQLTEAMILQWAAEHHQAHGEWPRIKSGQIAGTNGETWAAVDSALVQGLRRRPGGSSLYRLLRSMLGIPGRRVKSEPSRTRRPKQLMRRIDEMRDRGVPMLAIARVLGMTVEEVEALLPKPSRMPGRSTWPKPKELS
jgi:hypothetical protein